MSMKLDVKIVVKDGIPWMVFDNGAKRHASPTEVMLWNALRTETNRVKDYKVRLENVKKHYAEIKEALGKWGETLSQMTAQPVGGKANGSATTTEPSTPVVSGTTPTPQATPAASPSTPAQSPGQALRARLEARLAANKQTGAAPIP